MKRENDLIVSLDLSTVAVVGRIMSFLKEHPEDGPQRLEAFFSAKDAWVLNDDQVCQLTGWSASYLQKLRARKKISYLPTKPVGYLIWTLKQDLEKMAVGGIFGPPRRRKKRKASSVA